MPWADPKMTTHTQSPSLIACMHIRTTPPKKIFITCQHFNGAAYTRKTLCKKALTDEARKLVHYAETSGILSRLSVRARLKGTEQPERSFPVLENPTEGSTSLTRTNPSCLYTVAPRLPVYRAENEEP
jgi:hypothetical protein